MDEQRHRRRRPSNLPEQPNQAREVSEKEAKTPLAPSQEQNHHRRKRQKRQEDTQTVNKTSCENDGGSVFWDPYANAPEQEEQKKQETPLEGTLHAVSSLDRLICRIGDCCLLAIKWTGIAALFAAGAAGKWIVRLGKKAKRFLRSTGRKTLSGAVHTGRRIRQTQKPLNAQDEVTLVALRPDEYKGMSDKRSHKQHHGLPHIGQEQKRVVRAPKKKVSPVYSAAMAVLICIALVSVYMILSIVWRSVSTKRLSDELSQRYSQLSEESAEVQNTPTPEGPMIVLAQESTTEPLSTPTSAPESTPQSAQAASTPEPKKKDVVRSTKFHQIGGDALPEMAALYQENRDLTGWLRMEGILDLPVVYKDNSYYLTRDFYKNKSASGTLFLDENHPFRENAQNLLLHGHNMKDGTMFGRLVQYETNLQFLKNNPFIQYSTLWKKEQYVIFAVLHVSLDVKSKDFFNYFTHHTFSSDTQFENYVRALQNRSVFSIPVDVDPSDALLTLSTCLDEDRLVIVARRLREGESKSELRHLVQLSARQ